MNDILSIKQMLFLIEILNDNYERCNKLELVYFPKGKWCVYPQMVYRLAIVIAFLAFLIAFLAISDQYATFYFFWLLFHKMAAGGHFGWQKITFDRISHHFRSILNFYLFWILFTKWVPAAILDDEKSISIASRHFRSIRNFILFWFFLNKMAAGGNFGWPKFTFDHISRHFRSIRNFSQNGHFGWPKITFDRISRHFRSIRNFYFFPQNGCRRPLWINENRFQSFNT